MARSKPMNHPEHILKTLDSYLERPTRLILYGRAALALGYKNTPQTFQSTLDVDVILPEVEMSSIDEDEQFWNAIESTNQQLQYLGLYITHLFTESQVILSGEWLKNIIPIELDGLKNLHLSRPSTNDLILTKMMRIDPQDRSDLTFLFAKSHLEKDGLEELFLSARIPEVPEILEAFQYNSEFLRTLS
jgi:hypothetical protein